MIPSGEGLKQGSASFSVIGQNSKCFGFAGHKLRVETYLTLLLSHQSSHRQYIKWAMLCSSKLYFQNRLQAGFG